MFEETLLKIGRKYKRDELLQLALNNIDSKKKTLEIKSNRIVNLTNENKSLKLKINSLEEEKQIRIKYETDFKDRFKKSYKTNYNVTDEVHKKTLRINDALNIANKQLKKQLIINLKQKSKRMENQLTRATIAFFACLILSSITETESIKYLFVSGAVLEFVLMCYSWYKNRQRTKNETK